MNTYNILLPILYITLVAGVIALIVLLCRRKDDRRFEKVSSLSSFMTSVAAIIIGVVTLSIMKHQEDNERLHNQPVFEVTYETENDENGVPCKEDYLISIVEGKIRGLSGIKETTFLEVRYFNPSWSEKTYQVKTWAIADYFDQVITPQLTKNKVGVLAYSKALDNNLSYMNELGTAIKEYADNSKTKLYLTVRPLHYFEIEYTDIYGAKQKKYICVNHEIDESELKQIKEETVNYYESSDIVGVKNGSISALSIERIMQTLFPDDFNNSQTIN